MKCWKATNTACYCTEKHLHLRLKFYLELENHSLTGTHYVHNITAVASTTRPGEIEICGDFVANTTARGFLVIANSSDTFHYNVSYRQGHEKSSCTILHVLSSLKYNYSVFTLDEAGLPISKSADVSNQVFLTMAEGIYLSYS